MNYRIFFVLILLMGIILSTGCLSNQPKSPQVAVVSQTPAPAGEPSPVVAKTVSIAPTLAETKVPAEPAKTPEVSAPLKQASDMGSFISSSFPRVTEIYGEIKKSRNALEWKQVQDQALKLQILLQDLKKTNKLNVPNPEKTVFPGLDSRQQIVFLKYLQYLDDMESYANNLKNAIYYQEKGSDPQSAQTSRRYQDQADQFEKQAIAEVKTISDYCNDFKYTFFDSKLSGQYRYVG